MPAVPACIGAYDAEITAVKCLIRLLAMDESTHAQIRLEIDGSYYNDRKESKML